MVTCEVVMIPVILLICSSVPAPVSLSFFHLLSAMAPKRSLHFSMWACVRVKCIRGLYDLPPDGECIQLQMNYQCVSVCWVKARAQLLPKPFLPQQFLPAIHRVDPLPLAPSIRLQWTITALWGVDTFCCSSICAVVINFSLCPWLGLHYPATWSSMICSNHQSHKNRTTISREIFIYGSYDLNRLDLVTDEYEDNNEVYL